MTFSPCVKGRLYPLLYRFILIMKLTVFLSTVFILQVVAESKAQKINLSARNVALQEVMHKLKRQQGFSFFFLGEHIAETRVNIDIRNATLDDAMEAILAPKNLEWYIEDKTIIIKRSSRTSVRNPLSDPISEAIQRRTITGRITDEQSNPLEGVTVRVKGTNVASITDIAGIYEIDVPENGTTLTYSAIGFEAAESTIGNRTVINISLKATVSDLDEVVVVGYGTQRRSDMTGAVVSVKSKDIQNLPVRSVSEALQGRAAGVQVTRNDGAPGSNSDIVIRGVGSIGGMAPLYIVDGVRMSAGSNFNLQDIASIEILKDASAASIYGAQAAGGVVLITTKRGDVRDRMDINFSANYGVREPLNLFEMLRTPDYYIAKTNFGVATSNWGDPASLPDHDWVNSMYRSGAEQSYSLSLSGATAKTNYYLSANYLQEDGTIIDNSFKRFGLRSNADFNITDNFKVGETLYAWATTTNPTVSTTYPFRSAPVVPLRDASNPYGGWGKTGSFFGGPNPVGQEYLNHILNKTYALEGNVYADWNILPGLNFRSTFGLSIFSISNRRFNEAYDYGILVNHVAALIRDNDNQRNLTANFVLTYDKAIGQHSFKAMAGYEAYRSDLTSLHAEAQGFPYVTYNFALSNNPSSYVASGGEFPQTRLLSQFGRVNYVFADKYLASFNIRRDGSDRFGPANRFGVFPSGSVGWRASEEQFIKDHIPHISNLKFRASYGKLGSTSNIPQYTYQVSFGGAGGTNSMGLADGSRFKGYALTAQLANQHIRWETVLQTDIGVDIGLLKNTLNFTVDWYSRQTQGMIYRVPVAQSAGFGNTSVFTNIGQMSNKGVELAVDYQGKAGQVSYAVAANASFNRNLVKQLDGTNNNPISDGVASADLDGNAGRTEVGYPMSQFYGYQVEGIFQNNEEVASLNEQARQAAGNQNLFYQNAGTAAGDLRYKDVNGDGRITTADKTFIGNPWPKMIYGLTLNVGWRGLEFAALLQGVAGVDVYNGNKHVTEYMYGDYNTTKDIFNASFFNGNGLTDQPRVGVTNENGSFSRDPNSNYGRISSYFVEDGSFLKVRNLEIGYTFADNLTKALRISNLKVYVQAQNVFTLTNYSGLDPEVLGRNGTTARGIDAISSYPRTRLFSAGVNLNF